MMSFRFSCLTVWQGQRYAKCGRVMPVCELLAVFKGILDGAAYAHAHGVLQLDLCPTLNDTFYGVAPEYATATRPGYSAKGGLIALRAGLTVSHKVSSAARIFYVLRIESMRGAANRDSPLFRRDFGWSAGIGFAWTLSRSEHSAFE
ncbi:MAG: MipA/OmpV family protein [Gallionella sp.]